MIFDQLLLKLKLYRTKQNWLVIISSKNTSFEATEQYVLVVVYSYLNSSFYTVVVWHIAGNKMNTFVQMERYYIIWFQIMSKKKKKMK